MKTEKQDSIMRLMLMVVLALVIILTFSTFFLSRRAGKDTQRAVRSVSLLYLDELAERREQVIEANLQASIRRLTSAVEQMSGEDLRDAEHLRAYQTRMKELYELERFAFVAADNRVYTSRGVEYDSALYGIDFQALAGPDISVRNVTGADKKVVIAIPLEGVFLEGEELTACFMESGMEQMLEGISLQSKDNASTFCNIYTSDGIALTDLVLGGLASETNLLEAMMQASFEPGDSLEKMTGDFREMRRGVVSFNYNGIQESLSYVPINGTDWMLTYLIRESVISENISPITDSIIRRGLLQTALTALTLLAMFGFIIRETRRSNMLTLEKETEAAAARVKQQELEEKLALQERLLEEEKRRARQDDMITALASDYRSVYYVDLAQDEGICFRADPTRSDEQREGAHFPYRETFARYAARNVAENYREAFLAFIEPDAVREGLAKNRIRSLQYPVVRDGSERYEMLRMAGVSQAGEDGGTVRAVGVGFTDIDAQMRDTMAKNQALSDALAAAEESNRAKSAFLSSMSHEIRTPMNAIIGLDSIAMNDPDCPEKTREYLEKIGTSANHLLSLINDILDMSRIESGRMSLHNEEFSFSKLLEQINSIFSGQCAEKKLHYSCRIEGHVNDCYIGDGMKLRQVLINILGNAVKFTPEGGEVSFVIREKASFEGLATLEFVIRDTGIGMSADFLPHLFDTFSQEDSSTTSRYGSSGLGMAITKSIVEMMNGRIDVESEKGVGTVFTVAVTLMNPDREDTGDTLREIRPEELSVLVVDDDEVAREHARLVLEKAGIAAECAASGEEAVEKVSLRHARRTPYSLVLLDWKMPGMDGVETTRRIRQLSGSESAVIILTAYRWDDILEEAKEAGVDSFIAKPIFASSILEEFGTAMASRRAIAEARPKADLKGRHILLAEDVDINAEILVMLLQTREMTADRAADGKKALEMFAASEEHFYDAVLMDMRMPEMDGLEATMRIRALEREDAKTVPIIALTANAFDEDVQRSLQAGLNAHLSKPVEPESLYGTLESLIRA